MEQGYREEELKTWKVFKKILFILFWIHKI